MHTGSGDNDVEDTVRRIMGLKWEKVFRLITGVFLVLVSVVYVVLICDEIYDIIYYIMHTSGASDSIADKDVDHLVFNKFSKQYLSFILFGPLLAITFLKNLDVILKLAAYGVASVFVYFAFLLYQFFTSVAHGIDGSQIKWFDFNAGELTGTAAMAFTTHTVAVTIMKSNENQNNNIRDLRISYLVGLLLYGAIGTFGSLAIWNKKCE
jgi:sodium-coupled neutral amino acid transporter 9